MISDYDSIVTMCSLLGMWKSFHISWHVTNIGSAMTQINQAVTCMQWELEPLHTMGTLTIGSR
jgi:hypothetical protein